MRLFYAYLHEYNSSMIPREYVKSGRREAHYAAQREFALTEGSGQALGL